MVLAYITYTVGVFHLSWSLRSPLAAIALFFLVHVPLLWGLLGTGAISELEYFVYYPLAACAAALLGFLYTWRLNNPALIGPFAPPCPRLCDHWRQWLSVVKHTFFVALLIVAPALPLELYTRNTFVGGLVSLLVAFFVHVLYWQCAKRSPSIGATHVQRRTFFLWNGIFDLFLRLCYTVPHMVDSDFRFTTWPLYVTLASIAFAIIPILLVLELVFLRPAEPRASACREHECYRCAPKHACVCGSARCAHLVAAQPLVVSATPCGGGGAGGASMLVVSPSGGGCAPAAVPPCPSLCQCKRCCGVVASSSTLLAQAPLVSMSLLGQQWGVAHRSTA